MDGTFECMANNRQDFHNKLVIQWQSCGMQLTLFLSAPSLGAAAAAAVI